MIRALRAGDVDALARMLSRCSPRTRYQRFHGNVARFPPAYLRRCLAGEHVALVAEADGEVVAFASVGPVFGEPSVPEVATIVEDRWQSKGLGRELVSALLANAGVTVVRMAVCRTSLLGYLTRTLPVVSAQHHGCDTTLDLDVRSAIEQWRQLRDDGRERPEVPPQPR
ncbi:GNAT family N-acetyltransferase [Actinophytocola glycyrrhizae]|uniref:GNAT family N-acetyltransferase n=1 Tax=Actinophytocola glycyrrhizae TaxID=2044873 RepID=A0ABV9S171_9PSEU